MKFSRFVPVVFGGSCVDLELKPETLVTRVPIIQSSIGNLTQISVQMQALKRQLHCFSIPASRHA